MSDDVMFEPAPIDSGEARGLTEALFREFEQLYPPEDIERVTAAEDASSAGPLSSGQGSPDPPPPDAR